METFFAFTSQWRSGVAWPVDLKWKWFVMIMTEEEMEYFLSSNRKIQQPFLTLMFSVNTVEKSVLIILFYHSMF